MSNQIIEQKSPSPETSGVTRESWRRPAYTVTSGKENYELRVHLPGVPKRQAEVMIERDQLLVVGRRKALKPDDAKIVHEEIPGDDYRQDSRAFRKRRSCR